MKIIYHATSKKYNTSQFNENKQLLLQANDWADDLIITEIPRNEWLLSQVPEEFRSVFSWHSYDRGHAYGQDECDLILESIINEFKPAIDKFETRLRSAASRV